MFIQLLQHIKHSNRTQFNLTDSYSQVGLSGDAKQKYASSENDQEHKIHHECRIRVSMDIKF